MTNARDVVIVGGGIAGLTIARELARAGIHATVLEERGKVGGLIPSAEIAGITVDIGADAYTRRDPAVTEFIESLGLRTVFPSGRAWMWDGRAFPIPDNAITGIPADPHAPDVVALLSDPARVARDLELSPDVGADAATLGELVRARMGDEIVETIVDPIVSAIYSTGADSLAIDPGLRENVRRAGTLAGGVGLTLSGPTVGSIEGGMYCLPEALAREGEQAGARIVTGARVTALEPGRVRFVLDGEASELECAHVVVATGARAAQAILPGVAEVPRFEIPRGRLTTHVTMALRCPELDGAPRGSGILCTEGSSRAKALTHLNAKWNWLGEATDLHLVRVSYPVNEDVELEQALEDASELMGIALERDAVVDWRRVRWGGALTPNTPAMREWVRSIECGPGVSLAGVWVAGSGISAVLPHALGVARAIIAGDGVHGAESEAGSAESAAHGAEGAAGSGEDVRTEGACGTRVSDESAAHVIGGRGAPATGETLVPNGRVLRVGTRTSKLALAQARAIAEQIVEANPGLDEFEIVGVTTAGDVNRAPLAAIGGTGLFTSAVREALIEGRCDIAVHSSKDLPAADDPRLAIYFPRRANPADVLWARVPWVELPAGARVGTGSPRRSAQLRALRPDLELVDIRGNVPTRLARIETDLDAVVVARAGLKRLGIDGGEDLPTELMVPAAGQGALGLECVAGSEACEWLAAVEDAATSAEVRAERAFMSALGAGCSTPVGVLGRANSEGLKLRARYVDDGLRVEECARGTDPLTVGRALAELMREAGVR